MMRVLASATLLLLVATVPSAAPETTVNYPDCGGDNAGDAGGTWQTATPEIRDRRCDGAVGAGLGGAVYDHDDVYSIAPEDRAIETLGVDMCMKSNSNGHYFLWRFGFKDALDTEPDWSGWFLTAKGDCDYHERNVNVAAGGMWYVQIHTDVEGTAHQYAVLFV